MTTKKTAKKTAAKAAAPKTVTVQVVGMSVGEDGGTFHKGDTFETSAERAAALGPLVRVVGA